MLRATASKYGESDDRSENSNSFLVHILVPLGKQSQKYFLQVPASPHFCEIYESSKYRLTNQDGR